MNSIDLALALVNVVLCWWRAIATVRNGRLIAVVWTLIGYFAILFIPVSVSPEVRFMRGFYAEIVTVDHAVIHKVMMFVVAFNAIFAISEILCWRIFARGVTIPLNWRFSLPASQWTAARALFFTYWVFGGIWWFFQTKGAGYRDYVEGATWGSVIFWASSPLIILAAMSRHWLMSAALCVPFLYFCVHLDVRSFALLSLVPMFVVGFYQMINDSSFRHAIGRVLGYVILAGGVLVAASIYVSQSKTGEIALPDSRMPFGVVQTVAMVDRYNRHVGFDGLIFYGWNYIHPFLKLFGVPRPTNPDTPTVIAQLLEGVPADWPVYFHYPALMWTDAYISFGWAGLWMAGFWAVILCAWELVMRRNSLLLALLLPFFCWHGYMLVRGATEVASVPISYSLYLAFLPFLFLFGRQLFSKTATAAQMEATKYKAPGNLMT